MNADIHLEHRAGSSQGKHEGESSLGLCDRLNRTRDNSQRQLPTDHDYAAPTREYQTDQSSLTTAPTAARSVFGKGKQRQRQKQPHSCAELTRSLHIRPMRITQTFLRHAMELRSEFFHCGIFADNFAALSAVQSYLCGDRELADQYCQTTQARGFPTSRPRPGYEPCLQ